MDAQQQESDKLFLMASFARMDGVAMAVAVGVVFGLGLFVATAVLLLKGAPPGIPVGPNLAAVGTFLPGYSVSWAGSLIGAAYVTIFGGICGYLISLLWNFTHRIYIGISALGANWLD